jgi:hypothetical protein
MASTPITACCAAVQRHCSTDCQRPLADEVAALHAAWRKVKEARLAAEKNAEANAREREMLAWQVKEVAALGFDGGSWAETTIEAQAAGPRRLASGGSGRGAGRAVRG